MKKSLIIGILVLISSSFCKKTPTTPDLPNENIPVIKYFNSNPGQIAYGESATLSWDVANAATVEIDQGIGAVSSVGSVDVRPQVKTTYTLKAVNSSGSVTSSVHVEIEAVAKILIVNCQTQIYDRLVGFVRAWTSLMAVPISIVERSHDDLSDIVNSSFDGFDLLVISGSSSFGPSSPAVDDVATLLSLAMEQNKGGFGVCFGLQLLAYVLDPVEGALIKEGSYGEDVTIDIIGHDPIFEGVGTVGDSFITAQYHYWSVPFTGETNLGQGQILAKSKDGIEVIRVGDVVATQFHPESVNASPEAIRIFHNYLNRWLSSIL